MSDSNTTPSSDELKWEGFVGEENLPASKATENPAAAVEAHPLVSSTPDQETGGEIDFGETTMISGGKQVPSFLMKGSSQAASSKTSKAPKPLTKALDITRALTETPKPRDFALPCLRAGTVGGLVSPGGAGKSMLAAQLALMVATGLDTIPGLRQQTGWDKVATGPVLYASFEDGAEDAAARLHSIWSALGPHVDAQSIKTAVANLTVETLTGEGIPDLLDSGKWADWFGAACAGKRLVMIDTLRMAHLGDENDSGAMARLLGVMQNAAITSGAAILFLHHISKGAALSGQGASQQAARGSSVITDNARGQFFLSSMSEEEANANDQGTLFDTSAPDPLRSIPIYETEADGRPLRSRYVRFGVAKSNYSAPWPDIWLRRDNNGVLSCARLAPRGGQPAQAPKKGRSGTIQA
jgi:hypothetical protein